MTPSTMSWCFRCYIGVVFLLGMAAVVESVSGMQGADLGYQWLLLAVLTWVSGPFAIKVPTIAATISVSEAFVFTSVLLYGPGPATITVALDGVFTSLYRKNHAPRRMMFNTAEPAISVWLAGHLFFWSAGVLPLAQAQGDMSALFLPVVLLGTTSFLLNSGLTAFAVTGLTALVVGCAVRVGFACAPIDGATLRVLLDVADTRTGLPRHVPASSVPSHENEMKGVALTTAAAMVDGEGRER